LGFGQGKRIGGGPGQGQIGPIPIPPMSQSAKVEYASPSLPLRTARWWTSDCGSNSRKSLSLRGFQMGERRRVKPMWEYSLCQDLAISLREKLKAAKGGSTEIYYER